MFQKLSAYNVKKGQKVILSKDLPLGNGFGNNYIIKEETRGDIISDGFENGRLQVRFYSHFLGTENVVFNELSAPNYLLVDIY